MKRKKADRIAFLLELGMKVERNRILRELEKFDVDEHQLVILKTVIKIVKGRDD